MIHFSLTTMDYNPWCTLCWPFSLSISWTIVHGPHSVGHILGSMQWILVLVPLSIERIQLSIPWTRVHGPLFVGHARVLIPIVHGALFVGHARVSIPWTIVHGPLFVGHI